MHSGAGDLTADGDATTAAKGRALARFAGRPASSSATARPGHLDEQPLSARRRPPRADPGHAAPAGTIASCAASICCRRLACLAFQLRHPALVAARRRACCGMSHARDLPALVHLADPLGPPGALLELLPFRRPARRTRPASRMASWLSMPGHVPAADHPRGPVVEIRSALRVGPVGCLRGPRQRLLRACGPAPGRARVRQDEPGRRHRRGLRLVRAPRRPILFQPSRISFASSGRAAARGIREERGRTVTGSSHHPTAFDLVPKVNQTPGARQRRTARGAGGVPGYRRFFSRAPSRNCISRTRAAGSTGRPGRPVPGVST